MALSSHTGTSCQVFPPASAFPGPLMASGLPSGQRAQHMQQQALPFSGKLAFLSGPAAPEKIQVSSSTAFESSTFFMTGSVTSTASSTPSPSAKHRRHFASLDSTPSTSRRGSSTSSSDQGLPASCWAQLGNGGSASPWDEPEHAVAVRTRQHQGYLAAQHAQYASQYEYASSSQQQQQQQQQQYQQQQQPRHLFDDNSLFYAPAVSSQEHSPSSTGPMLFGDRAFDPSVACNALADSPRSTDSASPSTSSCSPTSSRSCSTEPAHLPSPSHESGNRVYAAEQATPDHLQRHAAAMRDYQHQAHQQQQQQQQQQPFPTAPRSALSYAAHSAQQARASVDDQHVEALRVQVEQTKLLIAERRQQAQACRQDAAATRAQLEATQQKARLVVAKCKTQIKRVQQNQLNTEELCQQGEEALDALREQQQALRERKRVMLAKRARLLQLKQRKLALEQQQSASQAA